MRTLLAALAFMTPAPATTSPEPQAIPPGPIAPYKGTGPKRILSGDSNAVNAKPYYEVRTADNLSTSYNAVAGTHIGNHKGEVATAIDTDVPAVVALGSNDNNPNRGGGLWTLEVYRQLFEQARADADGDCVVVVKHYLGKHGGDPRWVYWNHLKPIVDSYPDVVRVHDWDAQVRAHPSYLLIDGLHYTPGGNAKYAEHLELAAYRCP